jgi:hypothetical protein
VGKDTQQSLGTGDVELGGGTDSFITCLPCRIFAIEASSGAGGGADASLLLGAWGGSACPQQALARGGALDSASPLLDLMGEGGGGGWAVIHDACSCKVKCRGPRGGGGAGGAIAPHRRACCCLLRGARHQSGALPSAQEMIGPH